MPEPGRGILLKARFYAVKLPFILTLIVLGYILDFIVQLPFMVMCSPVVDPSRAAQKPAVLKPGSSRPDRAE